MSRPVLECPSVGPSLLLHAWRTILVLASLLTICGVTVCAEDNSDGRTTRPPNIVLIMADDLGAADLGCYGSRQIQTPNIDRLAAGGMSFTNAYAGHTVCAPSRCVLMTGLHTGHARVRANDRRRLRPDDVTVAELLQQAGYRTGGFGKWGLGTMGTTGAAEKQGFDVFFGYYDQVHAHTFYPPMLVSNGKPHILEGNAAIYGLDKQTLLQPKSWNYRRFKQLDPKGPAVKTSTERGDYQFSHYLIVDRMKQFIRDNRDRPFFCYAPWTPPHAKYHLPAEEPAWKLYKDKPWSVPAKVHAAFITMLDRHVGEVIAQLSELNLTESTMVIFMSDNGASYRFDGQLDSSGQLRGFKRSLYEGGIRSPLIVNMPGRVAAGSHSDHITYAADMLPTLVRLAGAGTTVPPNLDGISILPTLFGHGERTSPRYLYWQSTIKQRERQAARYGDLKFIQNAKGRWEVYNLHQDPGEANDRAEDYQPELQAAKRWIKRNTTPYN